MNYLANVIYPNPRAELMCQEGSLDARFNKLDRKIKSSVKLAGLFERRCTKYQKKLYAVDTEGI